MDIRDLRIGDIVTTKGLPILTVKCVSIFDGDTNRPIVFDIDFQGKLGHLFRLLKEILSFQYADFLGDLAAITPKIPASKKQKTGRIKAL